MKNKSIVRPHPALFASLFLLIVVTGCHSHRYLGQKPPGNEPKIFAPGIISLPDRKEEVITFSPDLSEVYYSIEYYPDPTPSFIMFTRYEDGQWSTPDTASFSRGRRTSEPFMAFGGSRIYYFANKVDVQKGLLDICYSAREKDGWSEPISLNSPPNFRSPNFTLHPCVVEDSTIYFSSFTGEICRSRYREGQYQSLEILPDFTNGERPEVVECWGDPFVSPGEDFMIFRSDQLEGYGGSDLFITFNDGADNWTKPQNLGPKINTEYDELGGDITPDGKYLTFGRNGDIYWVSSRFLKRAYLTRAPRKTRESNR